MAKTPEIPPEQRQARILKFERPQPNSPFDKGIDAIHIKTGIPHSAIRALIDDFASITGRSPHQTLSFLTTQALINDKSLKEPSY